ncbi:MAG: hypothetical protein EA427_10610 [Spirochaetaceae bacterium]|nr:MAG: hypothetical protein EA427_10610 [Spirochaetaceae bacterium]
MSRFFYTVSAVALLSAALLLPTACERAPAAVLERESRFDLGLGRLEDELGLFSRNGVIPGIPNSIAMRDGMIYIGNGPSNKIMGFTSYGDLVRLLYRPRDNPRPVTLGEEGSAGSDSRITRRAVSFSFNQLGHITVDSRRHIFAEDLLPANRYVWDEELGAMLNRVVLRFDSDGNAIDYIGQEGVGGSPFPFIQRIMTTARDHLVVITGTPGTHFVHFYSPAGDPITVVEIRRDRLPVPSLDEGYIPVLNDIIAGVEGRRVYLKVSYYRALRDPASNKEQGIAFDHARIYWVDLHTGRYEGYVELPHNRGDSGREEHFELVGIARGDHFFLLSRMDEARTQLVIMNDQGRVLRRRYLHIPERNLIVRSFHLDHDGVLTALLGYPDRAQVVWWRSDRLLPGR